MAPGGKAAENIGLEGHNDPGTEYCAAANQGEGGKIPRAHVGNDQEGDEEDGCRTEIAHDTKKRDAGAGQHNKEGQVPLVEEPFQRGRASEDITDFSDLRGLKRHAANRNPVDRSIFGMTEYQREGQQAIAPAAMSQRFF